MSEEKKYNLIYTWNVSKSFYQDGTSVDDAIRRHDEWLGSTDNNWIFINIPDSYDMESFELDLKKTNDINGIVKRTFPTRDGAEGFLEGVRLSDNPLLTPEKPVAILKMESGWVVTLIRSKEIKVI